MKVINALGENFDSLCEKLALSVVDHFHPDIVIGVLTGGGFVGRNMMASFAGAIYTEVAVHRLSTEKKNNIHAGRFLKKMPYCLLNWLRNAEVKYYECKVKFITPNRKRDIRFEENVVAKLRVQGCRVLIVDDCIDTGYTLKNIIETINKEYPGNEIKVAVITTAHKHPVVQADFSIFNRVLVRFPWSFDAKE